MHTQFPCTRTRFRVPSNGYILGESRLNFDRNSDSKHLANLTANLGLYSFSFSAFFFASFEGKTQFKRGQPRSRFPSRFSINRPAISIAFIRYARHRLAQRQPKETERKRDFVAILYCSRSSFRVVLRTLLFPVHFFPCTSWYLTDIGQLNLFNEETATYRLVKQNVISEVLIVGLACKLLRQFAFRGCSPLDRVLYTAYTFGAVSTPKAYESYLSMYLGLYPSLKVYQRQRRQ